MTGKVRNSAQVLLETVLIAVGLLLLVGSAMRLFANLNLNSLERIDLYRSSRLAAINGNPTINFGTGLYNDARGFLYYSPHGIITDDDDTVSTGFNFGFEDDRLNQAILLYDKSNSIYDSVLPYKVNQAVYLADSLYYQNGRGWRPVGYLAMAKSLISESKEKGIDYYNNIYNEARTNCVINSYNRVLTAPYVPGPFDPMNNPALDYAHIYGLDTRLEGLQDPAQIAEEQQRLDQLLANLRSQHTRNRASIQQAIDNLRAARHRTVTAGNRTFNVGMYDWVYTELNGRLDYAYQYLGSLWCWYGWCWPSSYHTEAINKLNEIATHLLTRPGSSPFLTRAQATTIQQIYTILKANRVDTIDTFLADTAANETVTYANLLTVRTLLESAGQNPFGVDTGGSLSFNMQDVTDTYNEAVSRGVMTRAEADAAIARVNNLNTETMNTILTSISEMRGPGKRLVKNLNQAIRYWEREDAATQQNKPDQAAHYRQMREFYLKECRIQAWALYEITDYVIACSGGTCTVSRR